jgi:hypothetical protein
MRVHKTGNFTVMSNFHFKEKGMTLKAKGLLSLMLSLPDDWNYSVSGLVSLSKDGKDGVMSALSELESFGYLKRTRVVDDKGRFSGIEYDIFEQPMKDLPIAEKPISEKSHAEKPPLLNTNLLNKKELKTNSIYIDNALENINDWELKELYQDYIELRKDMESPLTENGLNLLIKRNNRITNGDIQLQKALLEAAIVNQWKNVYLPNEQDVQNNNSMAERKRFYGLK